MFLFCETLIGSLDGLLKHVGSTELVLEHPIGSSISRLRLEEFTDVACFVFNFAGLSFVDLRESELACVHLSATKFK